MANLQLPSADKPFAVAKIQLPNGQQATVEVMIDKTWLQKLEELVRRVNYLT